MREISAEKGAPAHGTDCGEGKRSQSRSRISVARFVPSRSRLHEHAFGLLLRKRRWVQHRRGEVSASVLLSGQVEVEYALDWHTTPLRERRRSFRYS